MCFALFMVMLDNTVTNVALPSIQRSFDASLSALEWTINAYTLSLAVLLVTGGRLGDIFGRRRVFLTGVVIFGAASATIGFAPAECWLVASRRIDYPGIATLATGLTALVLALVEGNAWGWGSARIVALLAASVLALVGFVLIERRSPVPVVDFRFFASRSFIGANLVAFAV